MAWMTKIVNPRREIPMNISMPAGNPATPGVCQKFMMLPLIAESDGTPYQTAAG